jgi:hypothetical protein
MSRAVTIGGLQYNIPDVGEANWGQNVSDALVAISANISGGGFFTVVDVSSSPITVVSGRTYLVDTSASRQLNLPAPTLNAYLIVRDKTGGAGSYNITLHRAGGEKIDGVASDKVLAVDSGQWFLFSDGTDWYTLMNGFASNGQSFKPYTDTIANLLALPMEEGRIYYASDLKQYIGWNGTDAVVLG